MYSHKGPLRPPPAVPFIAAFRRQTLQATREAPCEVRRCGHVGASHNLNSPAPLIFSHQGRRQILLQKIRSAMCTVCIRRPFHAHPAQQLSTAPKEHTVKKTSLFLAALALAFAGSAFAQDSTGVTRSTDPAKAAAVERHAADLRTNPQAAAPAAKPTRHATRHHAKKHVAKHHAKPPAKKHHVAKVAAK